MNLIKMIIKEDRLKGFGFKICDKDGRVVVIEVEDGGAAFEGGLRRNDIIVSVNDEVLKCSVNDFAVKMNEIKGEVQLMVNRDCTDGQLPSSYINSSDRFDQISSNSDEKLTTSTSSFDLNSSGRNNQILDLNYVPEEHINTYLQPMSTCDSVDGTDPPPNQVTRKQAYKKPFNDIGLSETPRYSVKRATKSTSFYSKEPAYTVKKRTNTKMSEVAQAVSNLNQVSRRSTDTVSSNTRPMASNSPNLTPTCNQISVSPLASIENVSGTVIPLCSSSLSSLSELTNVETMVKIVSFKDKVKKTGWVNYMIESDTLGVWFHCQDSKEIITASNSTAIDPYIAGLPVFMRLWHANNNMSKFFLPIGQELYSDKMEIAVTTDNISVKYEDKEMEILINFSRLSEEKMLLLFSILGLKPEEPELKQPQSKAKRIHGSIDNIKIEPRKSRPPKNQNEPPRDLVLSNLAQTKKVENVPLFVVICSKIIERIALRKEGIYRLSGNEAAKRRLEAIVLNQSADTWSECSEWENVNTVASLLKTILRSYSLIDRDTAIKLSMINVYNELNQNQNYMDMMYHLRQHLCRCQDVQISKERSPQEMRCRQDTFKYLLNHLYKVSQSAASNKMHADNLATCFSPTIIEDIPCDDGGEYQTSKKSDADKNLKQMVKFWITNATLICDLLNEDDEQQRYEKLSQFCDARREELVTDEVVDQHDETDAEELVEDGTAIKDIIEEYTAQYFMPGSDNGSISMTDGGLFTKLKNTTAYQSLKKKDNHIRRDSAAMSPQETRKNIVGDITIESVKEISLPLSTKRLDSWATRSVRVRKKEPQMPQKKELFLTSMRLSDSVKNVPVIVDICVSILESYGIDVDGMYRVNGKKLDINILEELVVANKYNNLTDESNLDRWTNLYTVSGLLKTILKRFCLIKKSKWVHLFSQFSEKLEFDDLRKVLMEAAYHLRHENKRQNYRTAIDQMLADCEEKIRMSTLRFVLRHLNRVAKHSHNNKMQSNNLAICFMPVLMEEDESADIMSINNKGIQITEKLIDHCDWIFQWDNKPWEEIYGKEMSDSLDEYLKNYQSSMNEALDTVKQYSDSTSTHMIECSQVHPILEKAIVKSYMNAESRLTIRRRSDETDCSNKNIEYRQSKILDDSQLPDNIHSNCDYDNSLSLRHHSSDLQLIDSQL